MGVKLNPTEFNTIAQVLKDKYRLYGPIRRKGLGAFSDTDLITYGEISCLEDMVWEEKTRFSPKEIIHPITQTLFYFTQDEVMEPKIDEKEMILFLRPCDANAVLKLDHILIHNGSCADSYYMQLREKVKFFVVECLTGFETCSCVSVGSHQFLNYDVFLRLAKEEIVCDVKSQEFTALFGRGEIVDYQPQFIHENSMKVRLPSIEALNKHQADLFHHPFWEDYDQRCIGCGRCNFSCPTCTCFTMKDIFYQDNPECGERRRVWASCMVDGYTEMAGGHAYRKSFGQRMRFKTMHKIFDYPKRFGTPMCVGCGRCDDVCPEYISFRTAVNKVSHLLGGESNEK
ncbi:anaerobic sulfite reductase subunit AsrA [Candidatus Formimonas warabiya]|uniref:Anaerobic sulfite reductase subunit A n=1 Tax=Formimonas warabiya TaxID=1761012 RepID=A0A3G1L2N6_FORW1|nr:anaerobic sulfite reductase subunit AsrA [Candidatus Formimonas warabiya]ATW28908.1 anaerobic sulfite reductase subunit A [Candidatus Formimonas warabiya]